MTFLFCVSKWNREPSQTLQATWEFSIEVSTDIALVHVLDTRLFG